MIRVLLFLGCVFTVIAQSRAQTDTLQPLVGGEPLSHVEDPPKFKGGEEAMYRYIFEHIRYPAKAREHGIQGIVVVKYVVDIDSTLKRIHIVKRVGGGCDEEVIRIMQFMSDKKVWKPGTFNGKPVPVWYTLPVNFVLQGPSTKKGKPLGR
jgi:protein TonB